MIIYENFVLFIKITIHKFLIYVLDHYVPL
jgi:hypothetical protein